MPLTDEEIDQTARQLAGAARITGRPFAAEQLNCILSKSETFAERIFLKHGYGGIPRGIVRRIDRARIHPDMWAAGRFAGAVRGKALAAGMRRRCFGCPLGVGG